MTKVTILYSIDGHLITTEEQDREVRIADDGSLYIEWDGQRKQVVNAGDSRLIVVSNVSSIGRLEG